MRAFFSWIDPKYLAIVIVVIALFIYDILQAGAPERLRGEIASSNDAEFVVPYLAHADPRLADAAWDNVSEHPREFASAITGLLADGNLNEQIAAISAINEFNLELAPDAAWSLLQTGPATLQAQALKYLARTGEKIDPQIVTATYYAAIKPSDKAIIVEYGLTSLPEDQAADLLIDALADSSKDVKFAVLDAAKKIAGDSRMRILIEALQYSELLAPFAIIELKKLGEDAYDVLLDALDDRRSMVVAGAAEALGEIGNPEALEHLLGLFTDTSYDVLESAGKAAGKLADEEHFNLFFGWIQSSRPDSIKSIPAIHAFGSGKWVTAGDRLMQIASDPGFEKGLRKASIEALGEMQYEDAYDFLYGIASDTEMTENIRRAAITALGRFPSDRSFDFLRTALRDVTNFEVRCAAAEGLGLMSGRPEAVDELMLAANDEDIDKVLNAIVKALGDLGDRRAIPAIEAARPNVFREAVCDFAIAKIEYLNID